MHDPQTVIGQMGPFVFWHVDPETGGSDDSCGWSSPRLTEHQFKRVEASAWSESYSPWAQSTKAETLGDPVVARELAVGVLVRVDRALGTKMRMDELERLAVLGVHSPCDGIRSSLCFLPGYHENRGEDTEESRKPHARGLYLWAARSILRYKRRWWQHPKFHLHHLRIQNTWLRDFKRWAFSRCAGCGDRFRFGYAPTTGQWDSDGPRWFASESGKYHGGCSRSAKTGTERSGC